jgi:hypothetical protein
MQIGDLRGIADWQPALAISYKSTLHNPQSAIAQPDRSVTNQTDYMGNTLHHLAEGIGCGNVGISRGVRDFQAPVEIAL